MDPVHLLRQPPSFCQYADGPCDQSFDRTPQVRTLFLYPSDPEIIASTLEAASAKLRSIASVYSITWRDLHTAGQIIFCEVCKASRFAQCIIADVTTLNFNLMFEIGFALGLGLPVIPVRDTTIVRDRADFDRLALLDVIGYVDFQNADELVTQLHSRLTGETVPQPQVPLAHDKPLFVMKAAINTEGELRLMSVLKKSPLRFKTFDPIETPRLSLQEARRDVLASFGVIAHLLSPDRDGARVHNARCAFVAGIAVAAGKSVLLLQEGTVRQPIDYRQIVNNYENADQIPHRVDPLIRHLLEQLQEVSRASLQVPERLLERMDLGDVAAENEIRQLRSYFVRTGQFNDARRGHARLVIGRKGSGKTAIFYAIRDSFGKSKSHLILDLKPEGHQFTKLREAILDGLSPGLQEHTLTAFWTYILLCEIAQKISDVEYSWAHRDPDRGTAFDDLVATYRTHGPADAGDFSERLLRQVDRLAERFAAAGISLSAGALTQALFQDDIRSVSDAVGRYLLHKDGVWILVDNLDKGWPVRGATETDILIIRTLLESTRKLQQQLEDRGVDFHSLVFLRNDIYEHLVRETPDKGKETTITLDWPDPEVFKELVRQRVESSTELEGSFDDVWPVVFDNYIGTQHSFTFLISRTLMRPRDLLSFLRKAIEVSINRGHERVTQDDLRAAEEAYSEDMYLALNFELSDINPDYGEILFAFLRCPVRLTQQQVHQMLAQQGFLSKEFPMLVELLVWFCFLGVQAAADEEPQFAYQVRYNIPNLVAPISAGSATYVIHPAFRTALQCRGEEAAGYLPLL